MNIATLTPATLRRAADIKEKIDSLQSELETILGIERFERLVSLHWIRKPKPVRKLHWTQTPEGRAKMAASMKRRWKRGEF